MKHTHNKHIEYTMFTLLTSFTPGHLYGSCFNDFNSGYSKAIRQAHRGTVFNFGEHMSTDQNTVIGKYMVPIGNMHDTLHENGTREQLNAVRVSQCFYEGYMMALDVLAYDPFDPSKTKIDVEKLCTVS